MNQGHDKAGFNAQVDEEGDWSLDHPLVSAGRSGTDEIQIYSCSWMVQFPFLEY